jgi:hypothetical protein
MPAGRYHGDRPGSRRRGAPAALSTVNVLRRKTRTIALRDIRRQGILPASRFPNAAATDRPDTPPKRKNRNMSHEHSRKATAPIVIAAIGVVFGDIGTSPLYALKEIFNGHHPIPVTPDNIFGILSMVFWSMMMLVTVKYVSVIMRADNRGEGGSLALLALITAQESHNRRVTWVISLLGIFAAALFYGDSMITPAISVLSAVEGLEIIAPDFKALRAPHHGRMILTGLFWIQNRGTGTVGLFFGPVMCLWFSVTLGLLGARRSPATPAVLAMPSTRIYAIQLIGAHPAPGLPGSRLGGAGGDRRRGAVYRHGPLRPQAHPPELVRLRHAGAAAQLLRPGRAAAGNNPDAHGESVLPAGAGLGAGAAGGPGDDGHGDRLAGRDLGRLLGGTPGGADSATCHACRSCTPRATRKDRSTCPSPTGRSTSR